MFNYYDFYKNSKDPVSYRINIVKDAKRIGIKPTARKYKTSPQTVRKWMKRFDEEKKPGLRDKSKRPKSCPNEIKKYWYFKIEDICNWATNNNKRINAAMIKRKHNIPYSKNTILKVMRELDFMPQKRKKIYDVGVNDMPIGFMCRNKKLYDLWHGMLKRCYDTRYGRKAVG